jgi:hypothetical protein
MKRREFFTLLGGMVAALLLASGAQPRERMRRIGFMFNVANDSIEGDLSAATQGHSYEQAQSAPEVGEGLRQCLAGHPVGLFS